MGNPRNGLTHERSPQLARYAIYAAPVSDAALWRFGADILGYDPASGVETPPAHPPLAGVDWQALTEEPRRYGFHGTLKAPFRLSPARDAAELMEELARSVRVPRLPITFAPAVRLLDGFVAIVPAAPCPSLDALAADCVRHFDEFRAPLTDAERARRRPDRLSERQRHYLEAFGYPYVFEEFRFHMTLTGRVAEANAEPVRAALEHAFLDRRGAHPVRIDSLALFRQQRPGARFHIVGSWPFAAGA